MKVQSKNLPALRAALDWHQRQGHHLILLYGPDVTHWPSGKEIPERDRGKVPVRGHKRASGQEIVDHAKAGGNFGWIPGPERLIVDVDTKDGKPGIASYSELVRRTGDNRPTRRVNSGSGGAYHQYYKIPPGHLLRHTHPDFPGIDFISGNQYVVIAGSKHRSGAYYATAVEMEMIDASPELLAILTREPYTQSQQATYEKEELSWLMAGWPNTCDYDNWIKVGMGLQYELGEEGFDLWDEWSSKSDLYDPNTTRKKWESFGLRTEGALVTGRTIEYLIHEKELSADEFEVMPDEDVEGVKAVEVQTAIEKVTNWKPYTPGTPEPVVFTVESWYQQGQVGMAVSAGGDGKTTMKMDMMVDVALGRPWLDTFQVMPGTCVLLSRDDTARDLESAFKYICRDRELTAEETQTAFERVRVISLAGLPGGRLITPDLRGNGFSPSKFAGALIEHLATIGDLKLVVLDTARQFTGQDPSNDPAAAAFINVAFQIAAVPSKPTVIILHHIGKANARSKLEDMYVAIGSSAYADNSRFIIRLRKLDKVEVEQLQVPDDFVWDVDSEVIKVVSARGSILVKPPDDLYVVRSGFRFRRLPARPQSIEEGDALALTKIRAHLLDSATGFASRTELREVLKMKQAQAKLVIDRLKAAGVLIEPSARGGLGLQKITDDDDTN